MRVILLAFFGFLLSSCASTNGENVVFFDNIANEEPAANVTRVYIDAFGSLYPRSGLAADVNFQKRHEASLFNAFTDSTSGFCTNVNSETETGQLCAAESLEEWRTVQGQLWDELAENILKQASGQKDAVDLVFLVHGFNNTASISGLYYDAARLAMTSVSPRKDDLHFVEIYWDGFYNGRGFGIWSEAQSSGPLVGFNLRQLINGIDSRLTTTGIDDAKFRFLSHSSGAFVIGSIFGDPTVALPKLKKPTEAEYQRFADNKNSPSLNNSLGVPQIENLKIGMLAAATSSNTFFGSPSYDAGGLLTKGATVMVAINPDDKTLRKFGLGADFPWSGSTGLGSKSIYYCRDLRSNERLSARDISVIGYDFARTNWETDRTAHGFTKYIAQARDRSTFLTDLMSDNLPNRSIAENGICN